MMFMLSYLLMNVVAVFLLLIFVLVGVAYLTLLERKILSYVQSRKGPNKMGFLGLLQPVSDAVKLFCKEMYIVYKSNFYIFYLCPILFLLTMLFGWLVVPWVTNLYSMNYSILFMFVFLSLNSYLLLLMGWSSNSMYSLMGSVRLVSQIISYEVSFMLIVYCLMVLAEAYSLGDLISWQVYMWNGIFLFPLFFVFFCTILVELNRSPMDLVEGESELVSGFNVEYYGGKFALIFIGEYGMIIFFSYVMIIMFTNLIQNGLLVIMGLHMLFLMMIIFMRGMLPRMRYDELMYMCWKIILPLVLSYLIYLFGVKIVMGLWE